jgi:RNA polymerase sigma-70 factor (ECF subfamily)
MTDLGKLVRRCQQGELAAFTELFHAYQGRVYRLAVTILRDERDAEDALQDVFERVFERIKDYRWQSAFSTWLTAIVVNRCRDKLRRRKVRRALSLDRLRGRANDVNLAETVARRQRRQTLWALVDRLDDKHRLPVILHYHEGLPCEEVARALGLRTSTVYSRLNTARVRLRAMLQERLESESREVERGLCGTGLVENEN